MLTDDELDAISDYAQRCRQHRQEIAMPDYFTRPGKPQLAKEILGRAGEYAVAKYLGVDYPFVILPWEVPGGGDVAGYEVRTRSNHNGELCTYPKDSDRVFILVTSVDCRLFVIHGWAHASETKHPDRWRDDLPYPCFVTPQKLLHPLNTLPEVSYD